MKVTVITSSGHKHGTSRALADAFIKGAEESGHEVYRFDAGLRNIHPCIGCDRCRSTFRCVWDDDMSELNPHIIDADVIAFASPIYYYDINAQMKAVIDRFYANNEVLQGDKKIYLMVTMADNSEKTGYGAKTTFELMSEYMEWEIGGTLIAVDTADINALSKTDYEKTAYEMGRNV